MTGPLPKINPFAVPESSAGRALCPWQEPDHLNYYVDDIDNVQQAMADFTNMMSDLTTLKRDGRLVLVTGGEHCGKSSMVNWCVNHALTRMRAEQMVPEPIDLTATFAGERDELDLKTRQRMVGDRLVDELLGKGLVHAEQRGDLQANRDHPVRVFLALPGCLNTDNVDSLVILLPDTEVPDEVIRYSGMLRQKVLLIVESRWYGEDHIREVEKGSRVPLTRLTVGKLNSGDAQRIVDARFSKSSGRGAYPLMSDKTTIAEAADAGHLDTVGRLLNTLHGTYECKRRSGAAYNASVVVSLTDLLKQRIDELHRYRGRQD